MKKVAIFNQSGDGLFEKFPTEISAVVQRVVIRGVLTDYYELRVDYDVKDDQDISNCYFLVGVYPDKESAMKDFNSLCETLNLAKHGKFKFDAWCPSEGEVSVVDVMNDLQVGA